jgi:hypothetical protein
VEEKYFTVPPISPEDMEKLSEAERLIDMDWFNEGLINISNQTYNWKQRHLYFYLLNISLWHVEM